MLFDIKKESDKRLPNGVIEPLYKPPPLTAQKKANIADAKQANETSAAEPGDEVLFFGFLDFYLIVICVKIDSRWFELLSKTQHDAQPISFTCLLLFALYYRKVSLAETRIYLSHSLLL